MAQDSAKKAARPPKNRRRETFQVAAPEARSVLLVGDFTQWQEHGIEMQKNRDGLWTATVELAPGRHAYRFIVDGTWRDDPECRMRVANPFGGEDMVRVAA